MRFLLFYVKKTHARIAYVRFFLYLCTRYVFLLIFNCQTIKTKMKKIQLFLVALVAVMMTSCVKFKTEATVDVEVTKAGKPVAGIAVYKFKDNGMGEGSTAYKSNAKGSETTNAGGVAHFDLKSPDDLDPSDVAGVENTDQATFFFCTYDAEGTRTGIVTVSVKSGDKKTVQLVMDDGKQSGGEE